MTKTTVDIESKLRELQATTHAYVNELKETLAKRANLPHCISYFTYALQLSHDVEAESFCLGSLHILNNGNQAITNPHVHLVLSENAPFSLSGKFVSSASALSSQFTNGWERINAREDLIEYHLKPIGKNTIQPGETLSFSNFQLTWTPATFYAGSVTSTFFSDQHPDGLPALNSININGSMTQREEL